MSDAVIISPKGQITLPARMRKRLKLKPGDTLLIEETGRGAQLRKGSTILDFAGTIPSRGLAPERARETAMREVARERAKSRR